MKLCIAEKPSVAKEIARIVGAKQRKDGYFEGNGYQVSWTFGHLCTLKTPDDYSSEWKQWSLITLPMIPPHFGLKVINNSGSQKQFNTIKKLSEECSEVINCGDAGIEGELIQRWVLTKALCKKPLKRLWISSLTDEAIKDGFSKLKNGTDFDLLYAAGNARAIGDWLLGMNATRLYTLKFANNRGVLSVGRVQTPTLSLIVKRHSEIINFVPEKYWELKTTYKNVLFNSTYGKYASTEDAKEKLEQIASHEFEIKSFTKKEGKESPPQLFDLTSLQVECNKKFSFSAEETLQYIQKLYEAKLVSYPRVDTSYLPNDVYPKIKGILQKMTPYSNFTESLVSKQIRKSKKVFNDKKITDHHAIIPTGVSPSSGLPHQQKMVYDIIARRFIAAFYPDCKVSNTTVLGDVNSIGFKATGKMILEPGWRVLYPKKEREKEDKNSPEFMPTFEKGERGPHKPDLQEKETQPPKYYSEATLLRAMETAGKQIDDDELREAMKENGIGRPSTRANIIETLFKRKYIVRRKKSLVPTKTGIELIAAIKSDLLKSVELTGQWEKKLRQIENGEYKAQDFLQEMKTMITDLVYEVKNENHKVITIEEEKIESPKSSKKKSSSTKEITDILCPKCKKGKIIKGKTAFGCNEYKDGCNFKIPFVFHSKKLTKSQISRLLTKGKTTKIKGFIIDGVTTEGVLALNNNNEIELIKSTTEKQKNPKKPVSFTCPKCGKGVLLKGKSAYGCSRYKEGCNFVIPFDKLKTSYNSDVLTDEILNAII